MFDLTGKVTAIIGGGAGIGRAVTLGAVDMGATVICLDVARDAAATVAEQARWFDGVRSHQYHRRRVC